jgi:hypothetical protein
VRRDLAAPELPILTAQLNRCTTENLRMSPPLDSAVSAETHRGWSMVREAQRQAAKEIPGVYIVPTLDLTLADNIHTSSPSEVVMGERFAQVALGRVYGRPALDRFPDLVEAKLDGQDIVARFRHVAGGWWPLGPVEDFRVEDAKGVIPIAQVTLGDEGDVRIRLSRTPDVPLWLHAAYGADPVVRLRDSNRHPVIAFSVPIG